MLWDPSHNPQWLFPIWTVDCNTRIIVNGETPLTLRAITHCLWNQNLATLLHHWNPSKKREMKLVLNERSLAIRNNDQLDRIPTGKKLEIGISKIQMYVKCHLLEGKFQGCNVCRHLTFFWNFENVVTSLWVFPSLPSSLASIIHNS
jgi:hypothetical protein